ncbi:helix-turn-helix transcriptional regulator [Rhodococcus erythropolis]|jgi:predicted DNA-binding transcriptional regulator YafY|uniref:YafY family transcriptional regulator n=1 Tax=Rhodococcus erythropolis TaxID=1833 RepID=A0A8I1A0F0_RHOER|nr:YafY family protein [Rhodococcus erythropolis]MBH5145858.1 YafY family transcriptional regulator [Rhodococcus erythropolis]
MGISPRERMLRLLSLLQTGREWTAGDLAAAMDTPSRTLRRDIENLRELGYPVQSLRGPGGHYRLVAGKALPPLMLEDDEAIATILALKLAAAGGTGIDFTLDAAVRAADKLRRILPTRLRRRTDEMLASVDVSRTSYPQPTHSLLRTVATAISDHTRIAFTYNGRQHASHRDVEPARLLRMGQHWYLFGWDRDRENWRTFRLDRIADAPISTTAFTSRQLPAEDLPTFLNKQFRGTPAYLVVLTLHASAQEAASRLYRIDGALEPINGNRCRYTAHVDSYQWITLVLVLTDIEFTIDGPDAFRDHLAQQAHRLLRASAPPST